jgi:molybdopterin synthase catalytic subunit
MISVRPDDFDVGSEYAALQQSDDIAGCGAIVVFTGSVRGRDQGNQIVALRLEHYPGMTEKSLAGIVDQAKQRWSLDDVRIIHRVGEIKAGEQIVFVGVSSAHRKESFAAGEFIMDYLKTQAPFWKKELRKEGESWVEAKQDDLDKAQHW